jgi:methionyl-tRNA formyltransferase
MRSVVFAYSDVGYVCLDLLLELGAEVAAVFTHDDDPNEEIWFRSVRGLATERGLPVFTPEPVEPAEWVPRLRAWDPDFIFSFYYRRMLPMAVLDTARRAAVNLHGSLLPRYRGRCPVNWVLINGERETGVTLHHMVAKADAGDIVGQRRVPIAEDDTAYTLYCKQTAAALDLMREMYPRMCAGTAPRLPQDHSAATYFGGRRPADGAIDWRQSARQIFNLVRAVTHPYPGAFARWRDRPLMIWGAQLADGQARPVASPGTVVGVDDSLVIQTGGGCLRALRVQLEGEDEADAGAWARRHGVVEGVVLT